MAQHDSDLVQGHSATKHVRGRRVTQEVAATRGRIIDTGSADGRANHAPRRFAAKRSYRRGLREEQVLGRRLWSLSFDVVQEGVADVLGKRQQCFATRLADNAEAATLPVDVSDAELAQVPIAKTETSEQEEHGIVAGTIRSRSDDPLDVLRGQVARQRRQAPMGDGRDGLVEADGAQPVRNEEPKELAHRLRRVLALAVPVIEYKRPESTGVVAGRVISGTRQKPPYHAAVPLESRPGGSTMPAHPVAEPDDEHRLLWHQARRCDTAGS